MIKKLLMASACLFALSAHAADTILPTTTPEKFRLQLEFNYFQQYQNGYVFDKNIEGSLEIDINERGWIEIARDSSAQAGAPMLLLLCKVESISPKNVALRFMIISLNRIGNYVAEPMVNLVWGQAGEIKVTESLQKIRLAILARREEAKGNLINEPQQDQAVVTREVEKKKIIKPRGSKKTLFNN